MANQSETKPKVRKTTSMVANEREGKSERLPEHLYELGDGEWGLWRWVVLRGAGFAVREVLGLAAAEAAAAADRVTAAETAAAEARQVAIKRLKQELQKAEGEARRQLNKVFERVRREQTSAETGQISEAAQVAVSQ